MIDISLKIHEKDGVLRIEMSSPPALAATLAEKIAGMEFKKSFEQTVGKVSEEVLHNAHTMTEYHDVTPPPDALNAPPKVIDV